MQVIERDGDLTTHICADCGGPIVGDYMRRESDSGVVTYYHPKRCEVLARLQDRTGDARIGEIDEVEY
jgi:hypothetical protein